MSAVKDQVSDKFEITLSLVKNLIKQQFPKWSHLPIDPFKLSGWDNRTFHLGEEMFIRLPSAERYASQVQKEQKWLPILASHLSFTISKPLALGKPSKDYPWNWSVFKYIKGESANVLTINELHFKSIALQLAQFLNEFHKVDPTGGPLPGPHNFYRGGSLQVYDSETKLALSKLQGFINIEAVKSIWEKALSSQWNKVSVWIHGDLSSGNILIKDDRLVAVIDFGAMGIGDPACDLVIAWTFLKNESRKIFKICVDLDNNTWERARGWALWKALITLASLKDKTSLEALNQKHIIEEVISEYEYYLNNL